MQMIHATQTSIVEQEILNCIKLGMKDKSEIYDVIVEKLKIPRPTIRRVSRNFRIDLIEIIKILESDIPKVKENPII